MARLLLVLSLLISWWATPALGATKSRYVAHYRDGKVTTSNLPPAWHVTTSGSRFADELLFGTEREVLFLRDRTARPQRKPPYLIMANGDILPAMVASYEASSAKFGHRPTLLVVPEEPLNPVQSDRLPIRADRVERIITATHPLVSPEPNEVLLADGRRFIARSLKFTPYGLTLLTDQGLVNANFAEIADANFAVDRQQAVIEDSIAAGMSPETRVVRISTFEGAVLTGARINSRVEYERDRRRRMTTRQRVLLVQPAWALEELTMLETSVCQSSFRKVEELPLSLLASQTLSQRGIFGASFPWQRNASVRGDVLATGQWEADWGLGTHAPNAVAFDLPDYARELTLAVGLDQAVGPGGCVICKIRRDSEQGAELWSSGLLRGEDGPKSVGPLNVAGMKRIVLVTEMGHEGRPAGADPLDIRDDVVWLSPRVTIERDAILTPQTAAGFLGNLAGFEIDSLQLVNAEFANLWNSVAYRWDVVVRVKPKHELVFSRKVTIGATNDVLELATSVPTDLAEHGLELRVDGELLAWTTDVDRERTSRDALRQSFFSPRSVPPRREEIRDDALRYWWDLQAYRGRDVKLSLKLLGNERGAEFTWRSIAQRAAVVNLPASGKLLMPDVSLASLSALDVGKERGSPTIDKLPNGRDMPLSFLGQKYTGGYGMIRNSRVSVALQPQYRRFVALVGTCVDRSGPFRVLVDDRVIWEGATKAAVDGAEWIDLSLPTGGSKLTLETGTDGSYQGFSAFANAGFMVKP